MLSENLIIVFITKIHLLRRFSQSYKFLIIIENIFSCLTNNYCGRKNFHSNLDIISSKRFFFKKEIINQIGILLQLFFPLKDLISL